MLSESSARCAGGPGMAQRSFLRLQPYFKFNRPLRSSFLASPAGPPSSDPCMPPAALRIDRSFHLDLQFRRQLEKEKQAEMECASCPVDCIIEVRSLAHLEEIFARYSPGQGGGAEGGAGPQGSPQGAPKGPSCPWLRDDLPVAEPPSYSELDQETRKVAARLERLAGGEAAAGADAEAEAGGGEGGGGGAAAVLDDRDAGGAVPPASSPQVAPLMGPLIVLELYNAACGSCPDLTRRFSLMCKSESHRDLEAAQAPTNPPALVFLKHNIRDEFDDLSDIAQLYRIRVAPAFLVFRDGAPVHRQFHRNLRYLADSIRDVQREAGRPYQ